MPDKGSNEDRKPRSRNPMMSVKVHYGKVVADMACDELLRYLDGTVSGQVLEAIHRGGVSGKDWAWTLSKMESLEELKAEIGDVGAFTLARLKREAQESEPMGESQGSRSPCRAVKGAQEREPKIAR